MQAFLAGVVSILTPKTILITLIFTIALNKLNLTCKNRIYLIATVCVLVVILYSILGILMNDVTRFSSNVLVKFIFIISNLILGLWLLGFFKVISPNIESEKYFNNFVFGILCIVFSGISFSGTEPMIGSLLLSQMESSTINELVLPLMIYAVGLTIPFGLILFFLSKRILKSKEKKWMKIMQVLSGTLIILITIIGLFL